MAVIIESIMDNEIVVYLKPGNMYLQDKIICPIEAIKSMRIRKKEGKIIGATVRLLDERNGEIEGTVDAEDTKIIQESCLGIPISDFNLGEFCKKL